MKIHYRQASGKQEFSQFNALGIENCYFKELYLDTEVGKNDRKTHHHDGFEIHVIIKGHQEYQVEDKRYSVAEGEFLFLPPLIKHRMISSAASTKKFSLTFSSTGLSYFNKCVTGKTPARFLENAEFIVNERRIGKFFSPLVIQNTVFECVLSFLRICGLKERSVAKIDDVEDDLRLEAAKQYIENNVENWITVSDIAAYCYISARQITRIFLKHEHKAPAQYIRERRIAYIKLLLEENQLSLKAISRKMNFNDECYFNAYVRKHLGVPPGAYRKMSIQD